MMIESPYGCSITTMVHITITTSTQYETMTLISAFHCGAAQTIRVVPLILLIEACIGILTSNLICIDLTLNVRSNTLCTSSHDVDFSTVSHLLCSSANMTSGQNGLYRIVKAIILFIYCNDFIILHSELPSICRTPLIPNFDSSGLRRPWPCLPFTFMLEPWRVVSMS